MSSDHGFDFRKGLWDEDIFWEVHCQNVYRLPDNLGPDDVIVDIGAHIGTFAFTSLNRGVGRVYCFEAESSNAERCRQHLARYGDRAVVTHAAVCRSDNPPSSLKLVPWQDRKDHLNTGSSYVTERGTVEVPCLCLNDILRDLPHVAVLKIDCEGSEYPILLTASPDVLRRCQRIVGEYHEGWELDDEWRGCDGKSLQRYLETVGFNVTFDCHHPTQGVFFAELR